jgi:biopolymer transport protein ExbD
MLVALINYRKEIKVDYPEAKPENMEKTSSEKNLEIWINIEGLLFLDGNPATIEAIAGKIEDVYLNAPDTRVHVIADQNVAFEKVNVVLSQLQLLNYRVVSLVAKDEK